MIRLTNKEERNEASIFINKGIIAIEELISFIKRHEEINDSDVSGMNKLLREMKIRKDRVSR